MKQGVVVGFAVVIVVALACGGCGLINALSDEQPPSDSCDVAANGPCRCQDDGDDVGCVDGDGGCVCLQDGKAACGDNAGSGCVVAGDNNCSTPGCRCEDGAGDASCACSAGICQSVAGNDRNESDAGASCRGNCGCDASGCSCSDFDCFANVDGEGCGSDDDCIRTAARFDLGDATCSDDADCEPTLACVETRTGESHCLRAQPCQPGDVLDTVPHIVGGVPTGEVSVCITPEARGYRCDGTCTFGG